MKKRKIYRILKFIVYIMIISFACLGLFLSGFIAVANIKNNINKQKEDEYGEVISNNTKPIFCQADYNGVIYWSSNGDIVSTSFALNVINYLVTKDGNRWDYRNTTFTSSYMIYENDVNQSIPLCDIFQWDSNHNVPLYRQTISYLAVVKTLVDDGKNVRYSFEFNNANDVVVYSFLCTYFNNFSYNDTSIGDLGRLWSLYTSYGAWFVFETNEFSEQYLLASFADDTRGGSAENWQAGYQTGLAYGYQQGYEQGSADNNGLSTNPFDLISNAFSSLASILNITILPHLTLGVLIFTPLIFGILIVLFRMIKG